jgi:hypothetical protein
MTGQEELDEEVSIECAEHILASPDVTHQLYNQHTDEDTKSREVIGVNHRLATALTSAQYSPFQSRVSAYDKQHSGHVPEDMDTAETPNSHDGIAPRTRTVTASYSAFNKLVARKLHANTVAIGNHSTSRHPAWSISDIDHIAQLVYNDQDAVELMRRNDGTNPRSLTRHEPKTLINESLPLVASACATPLTCTSTLEYMLYRRFATYPRVGESGVTTANDACVFNYQEAGQGVIQHFVGTVDGVLQEHTDSEGELIQDVSLSKYNHGDWGKSNAKRLQYDNDLQRKQSANLRGSGVHRTRSQKLEQNDDDPSKERRYSDTDSSLATRDINRSDRVIDVHHILGTQTAEYPPAEVEAAVHSELTQMFKLKVFMPGNTCDSDQGSCPSVDNSGIIVRLKYSPSSVHIKSKRRPKEGDEQQGKSHHINIPSPVVSPWLLSTAYGSTSKVKDIAIMDIEATYLNANINVDIIAELKLTDIFVKLNTSYRPYIRHDNPPTTCGQAENTTRRQRTIMAKFPEASPHTIERVAKCARLTRVSKSQHGPESFTMEQMADDIIDTPGTQPVFTCTSPAGPQPCKLCTDPPSSVGAFRQPVTQQQNSRQSASLQQLASVDRQADSEQVINMPKRSRPISEKTRRAPSHGSAALNHSSRSVIHHNYVDFVNNCIVSLLVNWQSPPRRVLNAQPCQWQCASSVPTCHDQYLRCQSLIP